MQQRVLGPQHHLRTFLLSGRSPEACDARSPEKGLPNPKSLGWPFRNQNLISTAWYCVA
jgi:hypothetical protein